eukprot:COSAG05_NODE_9011_length_654_cov_2995.900901_2_plen_21_part_01
MRTGVVIIQHIRRVARHLIVV